MNLALNLPLYSGFDDYGPPLNCSVELKNKDLWRRFHVHETEMIITKTGRRMFPSLQLDIKDLSPNTLYSVILEMEPACRNRFKYSASGGWLPSGSEEALSPQRYYIHPESPARGDYWMAQPISFSRLKLTNTFAPPAGQVVLSSMHKYQPKIIIAQAGDVRELRWAPRAILRFPETQFIAVTAYQNERITRLKIDYNPFAKGFRENGQAKYKRKKARQATVVNEEEEVITVDDTVVSNTNDRLSPASSVSTCSTEAQPNGETAPYQDCACDILSPPVATSTPSPVYVPPFEYRPIVPQHPMYRYNYYQPYPVYMPAMPPMPVMPPMPAMPPMPTMWSSNPVLFPPMLPLPGYVPLNLISPTTSSSQPSPTQPDAMHFEAMYPESSQSELSQLTSGQSESSQSGSSQSGSSQSGSSQYGSSQSGSSQVEVSQFRARQPEVRPPVPARPQNKLTDFSIRAITGCE